MVFKYVCYRDKYREMRARFRAGGNLQAFIEELGQKDEELVRTIGRCSELEGLLKAKDNELEESKGVVDECINLQAQVATLQAGLEQSYIRVSALSGELTEKVAELVRSEEARVATLVKMAELQSVIRILRSERATDAKTAALRKTRLDDRIGGLRKKF